MRKRERVILFDVTTSMAKKIGPGSDTTRKQVMYMAARKFMSRLPELDVQGMDEEKGGGLLAYAFSYTGANDDNYQELDDVNAENFEEVWQSIQWGGGTVITPCWNAVMRNYNKEYAGQDPVVPLLVIGLSDGALDEDDEAKFRDILRHLPSHVTFELILIGKGSDNVDAFRSYKAIADASGGRFLVRSLQDQTDPTEISNELFAIASA